MVGPAINAASLATVSRLIGTHATIAYALVIALGAVACGIGANALPADLLPRIAEAGNVESVSWFEHAAAVILVPCLTSRLIQPRTIRRSCHGAGIRSSRFKGTREKRIDEN